MTALSASEFELIRRQPKRSELHLSIFQPRTILTALVDDPLISIGARVVAFDNVSGDWNDIEAGMTLMVGTTPGSDNIGRVRIRSATSSELTLAENSIRFQDNLYLTVLRYWEIWPIYPRIINDPNDVENVIFYKDYDIAYTDQNTKYGSYINAGPHRAAFREGGVASVYWDGQETESVASIATSIAWEFEGGSPSTSSSFTPGYVTYNTPGHYVTKISVTNSLGVTDVSYRYVSIYDRPGMGGSVPVLKWELKNMSGSRGEGGYTATIRVYDLQGLSISDGSVVVLFGDDWYGDTKANIGGNAPNNSHIFFVGHVLKGSIHYDYKQSYCEFIVGSVTEFMKMVESFAISVEDKPTPTTWFQLAGMRVDRALFHYLRWHSTVLSITDFDYTGSEALLIQYFDSDRESLFDSIDNFLRSAVLGQVVADRQGKIWGEVNAEAVHNALSMLPYYMTLLKRDWIGEPRIDETLMPSISYLEFGGIAYYGGGIETNFNALMACAPGNAPGYRGKIQRSQGLALLSQSQLNQLVGDVFEARNAKHKTLDMQLAGSYKNLDIAPQEAVVVVINPEDTSRNITLNTHYVPVSLTYEYNSRTQNLITSVTMERVTEGVDGETIPIPDVPEDDGYGPPNGPGVPNLPDLPPIATPFVSYGTFLIKVSGVDALTASGPYAGTATDIKPGAYGFSIFTSIDFQTYTGVSGSYHLPSTIAPSPYQYCFIDAPVTGIYRVSALIHINAQDSFVFDPTDQILVGTCVLTGGSARKYEPTFFHPYKVGTNFGISWSELQYVVAGESIGVYIENPSTVGNNIQVPITQMSVELVAQ